MNDPRLHRLLRPNQIQDLLSCFEPLLEEGDWLAVGDGAEFSLSSGQAPSDESLQALQDAALATIEGDDVDPSLVVSVPEGMARPLYVEGTYLGLVMAPRPRSSGRTRETLEALARTLESMAYLALEKRSIAQETLDRYREVNLLYKLGETLATCLDVDALLRRTLTEACRIIQAPQGAVLTFDGEQKLDIAACVGPVERLEDAVPGGWTLMEEVARAGKGQIINPPLDQAGRMPLLAVPLQTSERCLGSILLAGKPDGEEFTAGDEKLLSALAWQAAIALENARLFDDVLQQRDEIATMKNYMENIFASIASGVITTDTRQVVTMFNQAAEDIFRVPADQVVDRPYRQTLDFLCDTPLPTLIEDVCRRNTTCVSQEISPQLPHGDQLQLNLSISTLRSSGGENLGVAMVFDDVTEKRRYERERAMVRRYLPSELIDQLPHDLAELGLHGERRMITAFFADLRGFTKFSERNPSEWVFEVLNSYLALAERAVRSHGGIVDKYMGDAVMALFNTPLLEEQEHAWHAARTAWTLKKAVQEHYEHVGSKERLFVGVGICTGEAVVGNVGAEGRMEYTAIGNPVNLAFHLQGCAQPGQILLCRQAWELVRDRVVANPVTVVGVKGHQTSVVAYELLGLVDAD